jgi:hypothetical protein
MKMKRMVVAAVALGLVGVSTPAMADVNDISANMSISPSTFTSGEPNAENVAITFPLVTNIVGDFLYIDLPVGYVVTATSGVDLLPQPYDPSTGICGSVNTGITIPALTGGSFTCSTGGSSFPFEFVIQGNISSATYVINFAPGAFTALTTTEDVIGEITVSVYDAGDPPVADDYGQVEVTTLAKKLANTGIDTFATVAAGALAAVTGLAAISVVALRRRSRS